MQVVRGEDSKEIHLIHNPEWGETQGGRLRVSLNSLYGRSR